jgi:hypothetical protein
MRSFRSAWHPHTHPHERLPSLSLIGRCAGRLEWLFNDAKTFAYTRSGERLTQFDKARQHA